MHANINSEQKATTTDSTSSETTPLTTTDLLPPSGSVSSSISSPDLHMEEMELPLNHSSSIEYSDGTSSPPISPLVEPIVPIHLRSKSVPVRQQLLETIHSVDTTPRTSLIEANTGDLSLLVVQQQQGPSPLKITQILNEMSNGSSEIPLVIPSLRHEDSDSISSTTSGEELIIEPPSTFSGVSQYTIDTTTQEEVNFISLLATSKEKEQEKEEGQEKEGREKEEEMETDKEDEKNSRHNFVVIEDTELNHKKNLFHLASSNSSSSSIHAEENKETTIVQLATTQENNQQQEEDYHRERNELLFQELMGHNISPPAPLKINHEIDLQSSLFQLSQGELTPRGAELTFNIEPPTEFQAYGRETTPPLEDMSLKLISPDQVLLLPTPANYQRQTTPYTSIEDLPSALDELLPDTPTTPILPPTETVRRWHSFHGEKRLHKIEPLDFTISSSSSSDHSPPKKDKKDKSTPGMGKTSGNESTTNKLGFLRNKSFSSKTRPISRPISLVGLVHSTRDDSDLVDLSDAIRQLKAHTPDEFPLPPLEFSIPDKTDTEPSLECPSPLSPPPLTITITPPPLEDETNDEEDILTTPTEVITLPIISTPSLSVSLSSSSPPNTKKKNRWSLLRSKLSSSSSSSNSSSNSSGHRHHKEISASSTLQEEELISPSHLRAHSEPHYNNSKEERHTTSLFAETNTDNRRRGKQSTSSSSNSKEKRRIQSTSEYPNEFDDPLITRQRRPSRVQGLAREYSKRIKNESPTLSDRHGGASTSTTTDDSQPRWVKALKEKRRQRAHAFTMSENISDRIRRPDIEITTSSHDDDRHISSPLTPVSVNFETPSFDSPPLTPMEGVGHQSTLVSSQSFTADSYRGTNLSSPDSAIYQGENSATDQKTLKKNAHTSLQRFSSESVLHQRQRQKEEEEVEEEERKRGIKGTGKDKSKQKRGWVKSLVSKFNSNK